jgi:hypothetical protein
MIVKWIVNEQPEGAVEDFEEDSYLQPFLTQSDI